MKTRKQLIDFEHKGNEKHSFKLRPTLLSLCMLTFIGGYSQTGQVNLNLKNATVKELFREIEKQTSYRFSYRDIEINNKGGITISGQGKELKEVLTNELAKQQLSYTVSGNKIIVSPAKEEAISTKEKKVTGKVLDAKGEPVIGATIMEKGTSNGTITDFDGNFALEVSDNAIIDISYIGYQSQSITAISGKELAITLREDTELLDEVVVVGYGVQKKKLVTGATVQVKGEDLQKLNTVSALGALQSQSPGVNITQSSGMPGEGYKVNIRGLGTVGNSSPLYVIDGVSGGNINSLNPADIESIDVLKDAASAAIYGARAANGVILITTRQGKTGKLQISYDGYIGFQNLAKDPQLVDAKQYMELMDRQDGAYKWDEILPKNVYEPIMNNTWKGTNWLEEALNKNAPIQNHAVNLTGGSEYSKFSLGLSYTSQEGIIGKPVEPNYNRFTFRLNSDHILLKNGDRNIIKIGENLIYTYSEKSGIGIGGVFNDDVHALLGGVPLHPLYNSEGEYYNQDDKVKDGWNYDDETINIIGDMVAKRGQNISKNHNLHGNLYLEIEPIKSLKFKTAFGYKFKGSSYRKYEAAYNWSPRKSSSDDKVIQNMNMETGWTWENTLSYAYKTDNQLFDIVIGQSMERWGIGEKVGISNLNSLFPGSFDHAYISNTQALAVGKTQLTGEPIGEGKLASFFGRLNYNYKEKYMFTATLRSDGSSNFARGHRWGIFPSVSAGWVITNEKFIPNNNWLDFFKLRGSWGQNGNSAISPFQYLSTIAFDISNSYVFGNTKNSQSMGAYSNILPNSDITWETSEQLDLGFDARFFKSRLGVAFDYYHKKTKDWLVKAPILLSYGTSAPYINGGDIVNKGIEFAVNWNDQINGFRYGTNINLSYNKNEVTRLANAEGIIHGPSGLLINTMPEIYRAEVGYPIGYFYGFKTAGVFQNEEQIKNTEAKVSTASPGDLIFVDENKDGQITDEDRTMIGNPNPKFRLGFGINMSYKGFDFSVVTNGAFGHDIARCYRHGDTYIQNFTMDAYDAWHGEGTSNKYPALSAILSRNQFSDIYIEAGDFLRIQNVTFGYDFKSLFKKLPLQQLRVYLSGQNLYTFTSYKGMDPEVGYGGTSWGSGVDIGFYPSPRVFMFGISIKY